MEYTNKELKEFNNLLKKSKVAIIGLGISNLPLLEYMYKLNIDVTIFDNRPEEKIEGNILEQVRNFNFKVFLGESSLENLKGFNIIFRSPSCLPTKKELKEEKENGAMVITEIEMFMKLFPGKIIGITGSDGKTTTTTLIYEILKNNGYTTYLGGNCGIPLFTKLNNMKPIDIAVLELSSFQLMGIKKSPDISVITNITPNHLNVHSSYEEYIEAKKNIFKYQNESGIVVLNYDNEITKNASNEANGKVTFFSSKTKLEDGIILDDNIIKVCEDKLRKHIINTNNLILKGKHLYEDACAAIAATSSLVEPEDAAKIIEKFKGVEHRLEFVKEIDGVKWYNDSIGTSPTRTIAGLHSFEEKITLIAGGYDKNSDYSIIGEPIIEKVNNLILIGPTANKIFDAVKEASEKQNKTINIYFCENFEETVETAKRVAKTGEVVLLSPASPSFDLFKNFEERGNKFKELVNKI